MRTALKAKQRGRSQVSRQVPYSAPIGGWNARDSIASMSPVDAVALDNFYPRPSYVELRGGCEEHATGTTGNIKTLATYNAMTGTNQLWGFTASGIYNVTSAGAVGASGLARTNGKHQWEMFGDATNSWLIALNGEDKPAYYDGSTWTAVTHLTSPALTGYTGNTVEDFITLTVFKGRLFFVPKNSLSFWYLAAGAAGGALTEFDLSSEAPKGGYIMACGVWTRDAGSGPDDFFVVITSEGEAIVYQGTNPGSANTWAKVGSFVIGKPLGRRCIHRYGGDCVVLTEQGAFPLSALLASGDERAKFALSYKIQDVFTETARSYGSIFGWKSITLPARDALIVNVPYAEDGVHVQFVMNTITKSWCRFTDWDAEDFGILNGALYFCDGTSTFKAWEGSDDNGSNITYYGKQAFQDFNDSAPKQCKGFMPLMTMNGSVTYTTDVDVDFEDKGMSGETTFTATSASLWGIALWGVGTWSSNQVLIKEWSNPASYEGRWLSTKLKIVSNGLRGRWTGSVIMYEPGSGL
jgi:hypothetical protein